MLEYKVIEEDPEDFTSAKKVKFYKDVILNDKIIEEAIIAGGMGGFGGGQTGLFLYNEDGLSEEESWNLEFEALGERQLLLKLADLADNREVKIT
jgi:hypothetical protein